VILTSRRLPRVQRLADVVTTVWRNRHEYDIAHVDVFSGAAFAMAEAACFALRTAGKPYVLTLRGGDLPRFAAGHRRRVARLLGLASAVTTPSAYLGERLSGYRQRLELLPNAMDVSHYPFVHRTEPQPRLVWIRSFHDIYDPVLAVETLALLKADWPSVSLTMVGPDKGDGSLAAVLRTAAALGVESRLHVQDHIAKRDVPRWLHRGDIFLNTSSVDNTPMTVCEAMACGLCVVSTNVGGMPYLLRDHTDALLVPPGNSHRMAEAVRQILEDCRLAADLSRNGRRKVLDFDWSVVLPAWERLLSCPS
jgi:glycosyltransferase involved in cell wall biosynthesis